MARTSAPKANYDRLCVECAHISFNKEKPEFSMCNRPLHLVSGRKMPISCSVARSLEGHCGPEGRRHAQSNVSKLIAAE